MRYVAFLLVFEAVIAALLFGAAGRVDLPWTWALLACHATVMGLGLIAMGPELRRERMRRRGGGIDRVFRSLILVFVLIHLVVAGLDAGRFGWSPAFPAGVRGAGLVVYVVGIAVSMWAMSVNRFFEPTVRIQADRGHYAVTDGPYQFVRHPGYAGMLLAVFAECAVLGSLWSALPAVAFAAVLAARTRMEDRMLRAQLGGYAEYAGAVRYRLVPCVW
ncbi:MAG: Isoprenylcysteine carboxyl methyltransferase [Phycisphaerales bacterium]|nr:Isoprenylcysteine carboxyl methyltransferase [Phycisphaerales bacterium]